MRFANLNGERLEASRELEYGLDYKCPSKFCDAKVILKKGKQRKAHFALTPGINYIGDPERETDAHLAMKESFQRSFPQDSVFIEYRDIDPHVVADILIDNCFVIETQNSSISREEIERRNSIYRQYNFIPAWILHMDESPTHCFDPGIYGKMHFIDDSTLALYCDRNGDYYLGDKLLEINDHTIHSIDKTIFKLKDAEQYINELRGGVFYLSFAQDYMPTDDDLDFSGEHGPYLRFCTFDRIRARKSLFCLTSETKVSTKEELENLILEGPKMAVERKNQVLEAARQREDSKKGYKGLDVDVEAYNRTMAFNREKLNKQNEAEEKARDKAIIDEFERHIAGKPIVDKKFEKV